MKILVTGATGLIGRRVCDALIARGHEVSVTSRDPQRAHDYFHGKVTAYAWDVFVRPFPKGALEGKDAIIHLAGEPIADRYWTGSVREKIRSSRLEGTVALGEAIASRMRDQPPKVLLVASAIGFYGDRGDEMLDESSRAGRGFLAEVCRDWEQAAFEASHGSKRTITLRIGLVLSGRGGLLKRMTPPFKLGLGAVFGSGRNWMSWIHERDLARLIVHAIENETITGPLNAVSPAPVTQAEFADALAATVRRPRLLKVPSPLLKGALGEMSELVLSSQRVKCEKTLSSGFRFEFGDLRAALATLGYLIVTSRHACRRAA